jgi:chromosome partitioning protein
MAIYLTFAGKDAAQAQDIRALLEGNAFVVGSVAGEARQGEFPPGVVQFLMQAQSVVVLVSAAADQDAWLQREVLFARNNARPIVPIVLEEPPADGFLARILDLPRAIDARAGLQQHSKAKLVEILRARAVAGKAAVMLNIKGGVGKTVLAANVFASAHLLQHLSIALIDLDPQHNLSQLFLPPEERHRLRTDFQTIYSVLMEDGPAAIPVDNFARVPVALNRSRGPQKARFDLVVGDERLFEFTLGARTPDEEAAAFRRFTTFMTLLRSRYDLIVIDSNPCATFLTRIAITACDHVIAPVRPEKYSLTGLNMLEYITREIRGRTLRPNEFSVLLNGLGDAPRTRSNLDVDQATRAEIETAPFFGSALLREAIPLTKSLRGTPVDKYAINPVMGTAIMRNFTPRGIKESLSGAAAEILKRIKAEG